MANDDHNPPPPQRFKLLTWYRGVALLLFLPCLIALIYVPDSQTPLFYFMFPAFLWAGVVAPHIDGAYLWRKKTPRQCYRMARYQRVFNIPLFAGMGTILLLIRSILLSEPITPLNWVLMIVILIITAGVLVTSPNACRQLRRRFIDAAHRWRRCYECGYDLRLIQSDICPECGYRYSGRQTESAMTEPTQASEVG